MYSDCHIHCKDKVNGSELLKKMDERELEKAVLMAPHVSRSEQFEESLETIMGICSADPERLLAFAWIEPTLADAVEHVQLAADRGVKGIKMIPDHWYPYEERLFPVYERIQEVRRPIIFHSGILWGNMDSSRFCRPVFYEVMLHFPGIKFALAHIGWPWTDECLAVLGRMRAAAQRGEVGRLQMYIDTTRGTPSFYRVEALDKAVKYVGVDRLIYGSDDRCGSDLETSRRGIDLDRDIICSQLRRTEGEFRQIAADNLDDFLIPMD